MGRYELDMSKPMHRLAARKVVIMRATRKKTTTTMMRVMVLAIAVALLKTKRDCDASRVFSSEVIFSRHGVAASVV